MGNGWQPDPAWQRLPGSGAPCVVGTWLARTSRGRVVVKRLRPPEPGEPDAWWNPADLGWWRREADVASTGRVLATPGLHAPDTLGVEQDAHGVTVTSAWVDRDRLETVTGTSGAAALARFAGADLGTAPWLLRRQLAQRLALVARRGGWQLLARTPIADVADHLWRSRERHLAELDELPVVAQHGDPTPANLLGEDATHGDEAAGVVAVDWALLGLGPVGADLGYWALSVREGFATLLDAYAEALPEGSAAPEQARHGARVTAVYTALTRADWALARVAPGEGPLEGKLRHPAVAPHLRTLQRLYDEVEALL